MNVWLARDRSDDHNRIGSVFMYLKKPIRRKDKPGYWFEDDGRGNFSTGRYIGPELLGCAVVGCLPIKFKLIRYK